MVFVVCLTNVMQGLRRVNFERKMSIMIVKIYPFTFEPCWRGESITNTISPSLSAVVPWSVIVGWSRFFGWLWISSIQYVLYQNKPEIITQCRGKNKGSLHPPDLRERESQTYPIWLIENPPEKKAPLKILSIFTSVVEKKARKKRL